jgi:hypothetical protein
VPASDFVLIIAANSSGEFTVRSPPMLPSFSITSGDAIVLRRSAFRRSMIALGVPAGAARPYHVRNS